MLLRHIHYFLAVAEHRSFTRAAAALFVSQPALSQQIKQLEETLGAQLFDRSARTLRLTDAGDIYARYARRALCDLAEGKRAIHDIDNLSSGSLRLAMTPTFTRYLLGPLIASFHERYPNITLSVREMPQDLIEQGLANDDIDVGVAFSAVGMAEIAAQPLLVETLALVVAQSHPLAVRDTLALQALDKERLVLLTSEFATREQIDHYFRQNAIFPQVMMEANSLSAVIEIIRRTHLATLLPTRIALEQDALIAIPLTPSLLQRTAVLLHRKGAWQTAAARAFIGLAQETAEALR